MKTSMILKHFAFFGVLMLFLAGCKSDQYYQARAAEDAREYLLEHAPELTADQVCYVKYNDPVLLSGEGLGDPNSLGGYQTTNAHIRQICVVWDIPGRDELYIVCGFSEERMQFWSPNRLIRKKFKLEPQLQDAMLEKSRKYLLNNLTDDLTTEEINRVRFTYPTLAESDFEVNFNTDLQKGEAEVARKKDEAKNSRQYSLIWEIGDRRVVFTGFSLPTMKGWNICFAGILTADEVNQHTIHVVKTPENFNTKLIPEIK